MLIVAVEETKSVALPLWSSFMTLVSHVAKKQLLAPLLRPRVGPSMDVKANRG